MLIREIWTAINYSSSFVNDTNPSTNLDGRLNFFFSRFFFLLGELAENFRATNKWTKHRISSPVYPIKIAIQLDKWLISI